MYKYNFTDMTLVLEQQHPNVVNVVYWVLKSSRRGQEVAVFWQTAAKIFDRGDYEYSEFQLCF